MDIDDLQNSETVVNDPKIETGIEQPQKTRKKRGKPSKNETPASLVTEDIKIDEPLTETIEQVNGKPKKAKSGRKNKANATKKIQPEPDLSLNIDSNSIEPGALGQAGVHDVNVEVLSKVPVDMGLISTTKSSPKEALVSRGVVSPEASKEQIFNTQVTVNQNAVLPLAAIKVRNVVAKVVNLVAEIIPNKVIVQGVIHEQLFFVGNDGIVHHLADDIPFSTFMDIPQVQPGMNAQLSAIIEDVIPELAPDGLSILKKIVIEVFVKITETVQVNLEPGNGPRLLLRQVVGENSEQTLIENDITLFTPALKVDEITGAIHDITVVIIPDKVIIQGILHKQIFFVDTANLGRHQAEDIPFSLFVDIPGVMPGMDAEVQPRIEAIFFNLVAPATVRQKAVLEFFVKVTENVDQQVTVGIGPLFKVEEFIGENVIQELAENVITLSLPAIKVREIVAKLQDFTTHVIEDKVIVQGTIHKQIFFIGTDNIEHHQAEDIPFSVFLDIPGAAPGDNVHLNPIIEAIFFELTSATTLRQKVIIAIRAIITREIQLNLVVGTGPLFKVEQVVGENTKQVLVVHREVIPTPPVITIQITNVTVVFPPVEVIGQQQVIIRNTVELPVAAIKVKDIEATIDNVFFNVITDGVIVQGTVHKIVTFVGLDNIVRSITEDVPFSILVSIPGITPDQVSDVSVTLEDISFQLNPAGTAVTQNIVLLATVQGTITPQPSVTIVSDVTGPGIVQTKVLVQGLVSTLEGTVFQQFEVVTDVSGPGIAGVTKQTVLLQRVGETTPTPISVVTDVQLA
jgi:hypothetical protein